MNEKCYIVNIFLSEKEYYYLSMEIVWYFKMFFYILEDKQDTALPDE